MALGEEWNRMALPAGSFNFRHTPGNPYNRIFNYIYMKYLYIK